MANRRPGPADAQRAHLLRIWCVQQGITMVSIAQRLGVSRTAVYNVVSGRARSARIEEEIGRLYPELVRVFPFGATQQTPHPTNVAQSPNQRNCAAGQEGRSPTIANKKKTTDRPRRRRSS